MRLMTLAEGPILLSRLSTTHAVGRGTPRAAACLAVVSHPAVINALRISASFEACLAFALRLASLCPICPPNQGSRKRSATFSYSVQRAPYSLSTVVTVETT